MRSLVSGAFKRSPGTMLIRPATIVLPLYSALLGELGASCTPLSLSRSSRKMALPPSNAEYLNALAIVCEAAQKMLIPPRPPLPQAFYPPVDPHGRSIPPQLTYHGPTPTLFPYATTAGAGSHQTAYHGWDLTCLMKENRAPVATNYLGYQNACPPPRPPSYTDHRYSTSPVPVAPLTPPLTPESSASLPCASSSTPAQEHSHSNPVLRNSTASAQFQRYLDETWPEECMRRGSAIIRASLYARIADVLRGGEATTRFRHWVKKAEFFLVERMQPGVGYGACLAVPVVKSRGGSKKPEAGGKMVGGRGAYKLVARLEDFAHIIGAYHNNLKGHQGIRRTYAMVQEDFSYVPRTAVAKYIELCDICSLHRRKGASGVLQNRDTNIPTTTIGRATPDCHVTGQSSSIHERVETEIFTKDLPPTACDFLITPPESRPGTPAVGGIQTVESVEELGLQIDPNAKETSVSQPV